MQIALAEAVGCGPTALAAFDSALFNAGIANYNLIRLSSVIPPGSKLVDRGQSLAAELPGRWGDRLFVVMAEQRAERHNAEAWAGIGWVQDAVTGRGLFVEHEGNSEAMVRADIRQSLEALMATRGMDLGEIQMLIKGATCVDEPVCSLVVAIYQVSSWDNQAHFLETPVGRAVAPA